MNAVINYGTFFCQICWILLPTVWKLNIQRPFPRHKNYAINVVSANTLWLLHLQYSRQNIYGQTLNILVYSMKKTFAENCQRWKSTIVVVRFPLVANYVSNKMTLYFNCLKVVICSVCGKSVYCAFSHYPHVKDTRWRQLPRHALQPTRML